MKVTDEMVSRFLSWPLPKDFAPDGGVTFTPLAHSWPSGTNLLDHGQARAMLERVLNPANFVCHRETCRDVTRFSECPENVRVCEGRACTSARGSTDA